MNPWLIATACALGAALIAAASAWLRLRWPLAVLTLLLAAIATQLFLATKGQNGFHDLAALRAQMFTIVPALAGIATGLGLAIIKGHPYPTRNLPGVIFTVGLLTAVAAVTATLMPLAGQHGVSAAPVSARSRFRR